jgi:hypothetical protein
MKYVITAGTFTGLFTTNRFMRIRMIRFTVIRIRGSFTPLKLIHAVFLSLLSGVKSSIHYKRENREGAIMNKRHLLFLCCFCFCLNIFGQNVTNNNSITINGNVYYFRPSTTPSSPQPRADSNNFISYGRWYGADAAKAWASIADWVYDHCEGVIHNGMDTIGNTANVYISSVEAAPRFLPEGSNSRSIAFPNHIIINYWIVPKGAPMENGDRNNRVFLFK